MRHPPLLQPLFSLANMGVSEGKPIGNWFGPNTIAQVLKYLLDFISQIVGYDIALALG